MTGYANMCVLQSVFKDMSLTQHKPRQILLTDSDNESFVITTRNCRDYFVNENGSYVPISSIVSSSSFGGRRRLCFLCPPLTYNIDVIASEYEKIKDLNMVDCRTV
jgi:hypothetical protein